MSFFAAGGFVMYPLTVVALAAVGLALRHLVAPSEGAARAAATARTATALLALGGSALDLWAVGQAVASGAFADADLTAIALVGGGEAMVPTAFGFALAGLAGLLASFGDTRRPAAAMPA